MTAFILGQLIGSLLGMVATSAPPAAPPVLNARVLLAIGGADESRDPYVFENVGGLMLTRTGQIVVAEAKSNNIRVFGADGKLEYAFGRSGQGPGDLKNPCCISIDKRGRLWVEDLGNRRYCVFGFGAKLAETLWCERMPMQPAYQFDRIWWDAAGRVIDLGNAYVQSTQTLYYLRSTLDSAGTVVHQDTLPNAPKDSLARTATFSRTDPVTHATGSSSIAQPFSPTDLRTLGPNGEVAEAISSRYSVAWYDSARKLITRIARQVTAPATSKREVAHADSIMAKYAERQHVARSEIPFGVPARKMPLKHLAFDLDGRLWVERSVADGQPSEADVYDHSGRWVATMRWAANIRFEMAAIRGNDGVALQTDDIGTISVVRLRFQ